MPTLTTPSATTHSLAVQHHGFFNRAMAPVRPVITAATATVRQRQLDRLFAVRQLPATQRALARASGVPDPASPIAVQTFSQTELSQALALLLKNQTAAPQGPKSPLSLAHIVKALTTVIAQVHVLYTDHQLAVRKRQGESITLAPQKIAAVTPTAPATTLIASEEEHGTAEPVHGRLLPARPKEPTKGKAYTEAIAATLQRPEGETKAADIIDDEEGWMQKTGKADNGSHIAESPSITGLLRKAVARIASKKESQPIRIIEEHPAPIIIEEVVKEVEVQVPRTTFLERFSRKQLHAPVGSVKEELIPALRPGAQADEGTDDASATQGIVDIPHPDTATRGSNGREKPRTISARELKEEATRIKDAEQHLETEKKKPEQQKLQPEKAPETSAATIIRRKKIIRQKSGALRQILLGISHFGLGKERTNFIQNLGTMLDAGLPLLDTLHALATETHVKPMRALIGRIAEMVENGMPLWRAMQQEYFFTLHAIALVRIGEEAGNLAKNIVYLSEQEEKDHALRAKVKMAMIYPSIVLSLMFVIVMVLGMFVLPGLIGVLTSLNVPLPFVTRVIIAFTNVFTLYGAIGIPVFLGGVIVFAILTKFTRLKVAVQWVMFRIPGVGSLARAATIARFGIIVGGLMRAGVPVIDALQSLVDVTPIVAYQRLYQRLLDHITIGDSFARSFASIHKCEKLLPTTVQQIVITGEKSGSLSTIMLKIADIYDKKASETAEKLPVILEPMLLLFIGALVGTIAFGIIVPIYSIVGNISH